MSKSIKIDKNEEYNLYKEASGKTKVLIEHPGKFQNWCIKKWGGSYHEDESAMKHLYNSYGKEQLVAKGIING